MTLWDLVHNYLLVSARRCFPAVHEGGFRGLITLSDVAAIPKERWPAVTVGQAMFPQERVVKVDPERELMEVLEQMAREDINQVAVVEGEQLVGMNPRDRILDFLAARAELGIDSPPRRAAVARPARAQQA